MHVRVRTQFVVCSDQDELARGPLGQKKGKERGSDNPASRKAGRQTNEREERRS